MSSVTNTILAFSIAEDVRTRFDDINRFFATNGRSGFYWTWDVGSRRGCRCSSSDCMPYVGGSQSLKQPTFIAAFNYLDEEGLLRYMRTLPWAEPENVQLIVAREDDDRYEIRVL